MASNKEFAIKMMQEIGLEITRDHHIVDQDTGDMLSFNGKLAKFYPEEGMTQIIHNGDVLFDPLDNQGMMSHLFSYFTNKLDTQDGRYVSTVFPSTQDKAAKGTISCREGQEIIVSDSYYKDSLKYGSLISKLNGGDDKFDEYDSAPIVNKRRR